MTPDPVLAGVDAMRTRFELVLPRASPGTPGVGSGRGANGRVDPLALPTPDAERESAFLRAAADEALAEIRAVERQLSIFRADSWLARLNADAPRGRVAVPPQLRALLELCAEIHAASGGAFDPAVGPDLDRHGLRDQAPAWAVAAADGPRARFADLALLPDGRVHFRHPGLRLDLGAIGKGWALDRAAEVLADTGVTHAFLHAGTSTVRVLAPDSNPNLPDPRAGSARAAEDTPRRPAPPAPGWRVGIEPHACVEIQRGALSVSSTLASSREGGAHLIDPRDGRPIRSTRTAAVTAPTAARADAWSTALLVDAADAFTWKSLP